MNFGWDVGDKNEENELLLSISSTKLEDFMTKSFTEKFNNMGKSSSKEKEVLPPKKLNKQKKMKNKFKPTNLKLNEEAIKEEIEEEKKNSQDFKYEM
jgi:hypothetical protein